ncbi:hypothetical protein ERO13_A09G141932v2 [Gossypium hirsutum]|nr:hypothetical protein ERO13_A09G141932v2 [Gossypium hirsutum]
MARHILKKQFYECKDGFPKQYHMYIKTYEKQQPCSVKAPFIAQPLTFIRLMANGADNGRILPMEAAILEIRYGEDDPGISREKSFLWCPSSTFQELLKFLTAGILFGLFRVWARFRVWVY